MVTAKSNEKQEPDPQQERSLKAEEATRRVDALRHVYLEGYIAQTVFKAMVDSIRARVRR